MGEICYFAIIFSFGFLVCIAWIVYALKERGLYDEFIERGKDGN